MSRQPVSENARASGNRFVLIMQYILFAFLALVFASCIFYQSHVGATLVGLAAWYTAPITRDISQRLHLPTPHGFRSFIWVFVLAVVGMGAMTVDADNQKARQEGYASKSDLDEAKRLGLSSQIDLDAFRVKEAARTAELRKVADAKARTEEAASAERAKVAELEAAQQEKKAKENCRQTITCWAEKSKYEAAGFCKRHIENLAKYNFEWTDGIFEPTFSRYQWKSKEAGVITFIGDQIKFQNGFGAFQPHTYFCDYAPETETFLSVNAEPGRISQR